MYWLNIEWGDGTESTYDTSPHYRQRPVAMRLAAQKHAESGCVVHVIRDGTVIATFGLEAAS